MDAPFHMELYNLDTWTRPTENLYFHRARLDLSEIELPVRVTTNVFRISQAEHIRGRDSRVNITIPSRVSVQFLMWHQISPCHIANNVNLRISAMQRKSQKPKISKRAKGEKGAPASSRTMGRPPLPRQVVRNKRVVTFVTEQENASLKQLAEATSQSFSAVCHRLIAQGLKRNKRTKPKRGNEG